MIYVLSGSRRETARWAESQGHSLRQARHVYDAQTLPGRIAGVRFVQLPGFETRRDRHAIVNRLKRANYRKIPVEIWREHADGFGGWYREEDASTVVTVTSTTEEPPASHAELVNRVLPTGATVVANDSGAAEAVLNPDQAELLERFAHQDETREAAADEIADTAFRLDKVLTPPGEEPLIKDEDADPLEQFLNLTEKETDAQPTEVVEVKAHEAVEVVQPVEDEQTVEEESKPKRTRRTKQQMAYDAALADWESNGGSLEAVIDARDALAKRHPDDERLLTAPQSDEEVEAQSEDDDALDF